MPGGSNVSDAYGLGTLSRGGSFESAPRLGRGGLGVAGALVAAAFSAWSCWTCASSVCTRALMRSRSSRVSIFSFMATSYFFWRSLRVGSYDR